MDEVNLSPPWYTFRNKIVHTFGLCGSIRVGQLEPMNGNYNLKINVTNDIIARALREILPLEVDFITSKLFIMIYDSKDNLVVKGVMGLTAKGLAEIFCAALSCNPLFKGILLTEGVIDPTLIPMVGNVVVVIDRKVVQYYDDVLSDVYKNSNEVAADIFEEITETNFQSGLKVSYSTYDPDSNINEHLSCVKSLVGENNNNCNDNKHQYHYHHFIRDNYDHEHHHEHYHEHHHEHCNEHHEDECYHQHHNNNYQHSSIQKKVLCDKPCYSKCNRRRKCCK